MLSLTRQAPRVRAAKRRREHYPILIDGWPIYGGYSKVATPLRCRPATAPYARTRVFGALKLRRRQSIPPELTKFGARAAHEASFVPSPYLHATPYIGRMVVERQDSKSTTCVGSVSPVNQMGGRYRRSAAFKQLKDCGSLLWLLPQTYNELPDSNNWTSHVGMQ